METIETYNDNKIIFNENTNRYELTLEIVKQEFGNPYKDDGVLTSRIKQTSQKIYTALLRRGYSANGKIIVAIVNHTEEYRKFIFDCMFAQIQADMTSAYNDVGKFVPTSKEQRELQKQNDISVEVEAIFDTSISYGGINLTFGSVFSTSVVLKFMEYAK